MNKYGDTALWACIGVGKNKWNPAVLQFSIVYYSLLDGLP